MKKLIAAFALSFSALIASVSGVQLIPTALAEAQQQAHQTTGVVKKIDLEKARVTVAHDPVPSLNWPGMTMSFEVEDQALLNAVTTGQAVEFEFFEAASGKFMITQLSSP